MRFHPAAHVEAPHCSIIVGQGEARVPGPGPPGIPLTLFRWLSRLPVLHSLPNADITISAVPGGRPRKPYTIRCTQRFKRITLSTTGYGRLGVAFLRKFQVFATASRTVYIVHVGNWTYWKNCKKNVQFVKKRKNCQKIVKNIRIFWRTLLRPMRASC